MDGILGHHSGGEDKIRGNLRNNFVLQAGEKEDWDFSDGWEKGIGCPDLMAEKREVSCWWNDARDQLPHAQESVLQHQPNQLLVVLILGHELH